MVLKAADTVLAHSSVVIVVECFVSTDMNGRLKHIATLKILKYSRQFISAENIA